MAPTKELEATLPLHDPQNGPSGDTLGKNWQIYSLVAFNDQELKLLESTINEAEDSTNRSVLATTPDFSGRTLRDVYEHHIEVRDRNDEIHPVLFIVVDQRDYQSNGVLIVDLHVMTDTPQNVIGVLRCGYDDADLYCANLDIGNVDFIDYKEEEERLWGGDDPYKNKRYFSRNSDSPAPSPGTLHYAWYSNVQKPGPIEEMLEPGWAYMNEGESRLHMAGGWYNSPDPWHEIRKRFPFRCLQQPRLHRHLFLVAEKDANEAEAISICRAKWDGDLSAYHYDPDSYEGQERDRKQVYSIMPEIVVEKKVSASEALAELDTLAGHTGSD